MVAGKAQANARGVRGLYVERLSHVRTQPETIFSALFPA